MKKPLSIRKYEFTRTLAEVINGSELPPCVVADTLTIVQAEVQRLANEQLQKDIEAYKAAQEKETEKTEEQVFYEKESEAKENGE